MSDRAIKQADQTIKPLVYGAVEQDDMERAVGLSEARGRIREPRRKRRLTAYTMHMAECLAEAKKNENLGSHQEKFKSCTIKWKKLTPEEKEELKARARLARRQ